MKMKKYEREKNFLISKKCPFCPQPDYAYTYKRWYGLLRHVQTNHLKVKTRKRGFGNSYFGQGWEKGQLIYIRIYKSLYGKYFDIDILNPEICFKMLYYYVTNNPSFRIITNEKGNKNGNRKKS